MSRNQQLLLDVDVIRCKGFWLENQSAYRDAKAELGGTPSPLACSASVLLERGSVPKFDSGLGKASKFYFHKSSFDRRSPPLIQNVFLSLSLCRCKSHCRASLGACNQT